jgi:hypothetical protein
MTLRRAKSGYLGVVQDKDLLDRSKIFNQLLELSIILLKDTEDQQ